MRHRKRYSNYTNVDGRVYGQTRFFPWTCHRTHCYRLLVSYKPSERMHVFTDIYPLRSLSRVWWDKLGSFSKFRISSTLVSLVKHMETSKPLVFAPLWFETGGGIQRVMTICDTLKVTLKTQEEYLLSGKQQVKGYKCIDSCSFKEVMFAMFCFPINRFYATRFKFSTFHITTELLLDWLLPTPLIDYKPKLAQGRP